MYQVTKLSMAMAALGLSTFIFMGQVIAETTDNSQGYRVESSINSSSNNAMMSCKPPNEYILAEG